jgi:hypothetical protein
LYGFRLVCHIALSEKFSTETPKLMQVSLNETAFQVATIRVRRARQPVNIALANDGESVSGNEMTADTTRRPLGRKFEE